MAMPKQARRGLVPALKSTSVALAIAALSACGGGGGGGDSTAGTGNPAAAAPAATPPASTTPSGTAPVATGTPAPTPAPTSTGSGSTTGSSAPAAGTGGGAQPPSTGSGNVTGTGTSGGATSAAVFQRTDFQVNTQAAGTQSGASVARLANGGYVVVWNSTAVGGTTEVHMQRLDAQGQPAGGEQVVAADGFVSRYASAVTAFADGGFLVTWRVSPFALEVDAQGQLFDAQGTPQGGTLALGSSPNGFTLRPMALPDGSFVGAADIFGGGKFGPDAGLITHFAADGRPLGQPTRLESQLTVQTGAFSPNAAGQARTALLSDGRVAAVWVASGTNISELRLSLFDAQVQPIGAPIVLDSRADSIQSPSIAPLPDGRHAVAWVAGASGQPQVAYLELFDDATGASLGRQQLASSAGGQGATLLARIASLADGSLAAAWSVVSWEGTQGHRELSTRRFDRNGAPISAAESVDTATWTTDDLPFDSLDLVRSTGAGYLLLFGRWSAAQGWDVRATVR